jgi:hypothetical protein
VFSADELLEIARCASQLLREPNEAMQIAGAMFLGSLWSARAHCFPASLVLPPTYLSQIAPAATISVVTLLAIVSQSERSPVDPLIDFLCEYVAASPADGLEACASFCQVNDEYATALFHRLFRRLMEALEGGDDLPELALSFCAIAVSSVNTEACTEQINGLADFLIQQGLPPLALEFFAAARARSVYFARYAPLIEERLAEVPPCASLFALFRAGERTDFSPEFLAQKTVEGIRDPHGTVSSAALAYASEVFTGGVPEWYGQVVTVYRTHILRAIFESMFDRLHINDFKKQAKFVWSASIGCVNAGDNSLLAELGTHLTAMCAMPAGAVEAFVEKLWRMGPDLASIREHLFEFLVNVRCAPPELAEKLCTAEDEDDEFALGGQFEWTGPEEHEIEPQPVAEEESPLAGRMLRLRAS